MKKELLVLALLCVTLTGCTQSGHHSKVLRGAATVEVLDEEGNPLAGEYAYIDFLTLYQGTGQHLDVRRGKSGKDGKFYGEGRGDCDRIGIKVGKFALGTADNVREEYYHTGCRIGTDRNKENTQWEPWNPLVKLHVRKKLNPVPMFAKKVDSGVDSLEKFDEKIGFDFILGDFTSPIGKGETADVYFISTEIEGKPCITLEFANKKDGIIFLNSEDLKNCLPKKESYFRYDYEFKGPRYAPVEGYENKFNIMLEESKRKKGRQMIETDENFYVFKIRTAKSGDGKAAIYGKIKGSLFLSTVNNRMEFVCFSYLCNPDGTRNLEFDPQRNLNKDKKTNTGFIEP